MLNTAWRHGIVGVENPIEPLSEVYLKKHQEMLDWQRQKDTINFKWQRSLFEKTLTSSQINFGLSKDNQWPDTWGIVTIAHAWKSKRVSPERFYDTHQNIFVPYIPKQDESWKEHLIREEWSSSQFNVLTGT